MRRPVSCSETRCTPMVRSRIEVPLDRDRLRGIVGFAGGSSRQEVGPVAIRTVGEPGFALSGAGFQTRRMAVTAGAMRLRQSPPLAQHQAMASGMASSGSLAARWCSYRIRGRPAWRVRA